MLDDTALDAADQWVDDWHSKIEARLARTRALAAGLQRSPGPPAPATASWRSLSTAPVRCGSCTWTTGVRLHSGCWIADQVLTTTRAARAELARRAAEVRLV